MKRQLCFVMFLGAFCLVQAVKASEQESESDWRHSVNLYSNFYFDYLYLQGKFMPAKIVRAGHDSFIDGAEIPTAGMSASASIEAATRWFIFFAEPYLISSNRSAGPTLAGLHMSDTFTPFACPENHNQWWPPCVGIGYYHHSAHNFADEKYGSGTFEDGLSLKLRFLNSRLLSHRAHGWIYGHWFWNGVEPAVAITRDTYVWAEEIPALKWDIGAKLTLRWLGATELDIFLKNSLRGAEAIGGQVRLIFAGDSESGLWSRVSAGPELRYIRNLRDTERYGVGALAFSLRLGLHVD